MPPPSPPPAAPRASAPHSAASFTAQSNTAAPPPPRQPRASSAFSRLANIALTGASTTGAAGAGGAATAGSPSFASVASTNSNTATSRGGGALDALETIAHADQDRWKFKAGGGGGGDEAAAPPTAGGSTTRTGSASRYEPRTRSSGSRTGWRTRDLSESRSRERRPPLSFADSGGSSGSGVGGGGGGSGYLTGVAESPLSMSFRSGTGWAGGAGGEQLPPNASVSAFSSLASGGGPAPGESHFFPHGSSAFSFETSGGGVSVSPWGDNNSYRSSVTPSFGGLDGSRSSSIPRRSSSGVASPVTQPPQPRSDPTTTTAAAALGFRPDHPTRSSPSSRSPSSVPSLARTSSPVGGGRKPKDASRALRYSVSTSARDKGLIGLAKPPKEAAAEQQGRVAVAGKTSLKILRVPYGRRNLPPRDDLGGVMMERSARAAEAVQSAFPASSIAARRSRSRGSPAPGSGSGSIRDGSVTRDGDDGGDPSREVVTEVMDVRLGSKLGPTYLFSDVRWGYGGTSSAS